MRFGFILLLMTGTAAAAQSSPVENLWNELRAKRDALGALHQEFEAVRASGARGEVRSLKSQLVIDFSHGKWREKVVGGSAAHISIFGGEDTLLMEEGGDEYVRTRNIEKEGPTEPPPYDLATPNWQKAVEVGRHPCSLPNLQHTCVEIRIPLKTSLMPDRGSQGHMITMSDGTADLLMDVDNGMMMVGQIVRTYDFERTKLTVGVQETRTYSLKRFRYSMDDADAALFRLPSADMREVKTLTPWDPARVKKQLAGKPAPDFTAKDMNGKPLELSSLKGKTVLLDLWATWCPPCRADQPALEKLYQKYGAKDLMVVGVSIGEDRRVVEKFLSDHPHTYPVVLSSENELPRPYGVNTLPTYIVIDAEGTVAAVTYGDQGFGQLKKMLKKAGLDAD